MTKKELRNILKEKRKNLPAREVEIYNDLILINFQKLHLPFLSCVHTYVPSQKLGEAETFHLVKFLEFQNPGIKVLVPKIDTESDDMHHFHLQDDVNMTDNLFGIAEPTNGTKVDPTEIDLVLVPLLAFDERGYRVGYGKGYYDRFLKTCRPDALKVGLSFFEASEDIEDINQFDIPLNFCVTPQRIYEF
ncbi:MAG: 5-formyltetrahydrofolate cyclo-ligase [Ginsengibacter sp.]